MTTQTSVLMTVQTSVVITVQTNVLMLYIVYLYIYIYYWIVTANSGYISEVFTGQAPRSL